MSNLRYATHCVDYRRLLILWVQSPNFIIVMGLF